MTVSLSGSPSAQIWEGQCVACHGAAGEGNRALGAPALSQLSADYLERQLSHFVSGVRGAHPDDDAGKRMALSVANLSEGRYTWPCSADHHRAASCSASCDP